MISKRNGTSVCVSLAVFLAITLSALSLCTAADKVLPGADESHVLARIDNLQEKYSRLFTKGLALPEDDYGPNAVSRGDSTTRFITLQNLTWQKRKCRIWLNQSIGLAPADTVELRQFYPTERVIGLFRYNPGYHITVHIAPCRAALLMATTKPVDEISVFGCDYQIVRDVPGKPVIVNLLGMPGKRQLVTLSARHRKFTKATLDGKPAPDAAAGKPFYVNFPGEPNELPAHRKLGDLKPVDVPADAEALCEAASIKKAYRLSTIITEAAPNTLLTISVEGEHNQDKTCAGVRIDGKFKIATFTTISFPSGLWRTPVPASDSICAYYVPVTDDMLGKKIDVVVLLIKGGNENEQIKPQCYITTYPHPYETKRLILE